MYYFCFSAWGPKPSPQKRVWAFVIKSLETHEFISSFNAFQAVQCTEADLEVLINKSKIFISFRIPTTTKKVGILNREGPHAAM